MGKRQRPKTVAERLAQAAQKMRRRKPAPEPPADAIVIECLAPDDPRLLRKVKLREDGFCPECETRLIVERGGEIRYCPKGCTSEISGEAFLELMDATGSGWIREALAAKKAR